MKIRIYTIDNSFPTFPTFSNMETAISYAKNNSHYFENGETIALVDYETGISEFWVARFELVLSKV